MSLPESLKERFDKLYRDNYVKVYRLSLGLANRARFDNPAGRLSDAEDITQEAFLRAFRSFHTFREDSSFFTWIYRITINVANDYMRQRIRLPIYDLTEELGCSEEDLIDPDPSNDPETVVLVNEVMRSCMIGFTECLPLNQKKAFFLVIGIGLPYKVAAEILDCTAGSIKTTLHRAKGNLVSCMESRCSLIKKSNTCHCEHFVKFDLAHGVISKELLVNPLPKITVPDKLKLYMRDLRDIYRSVYLSDMSDEVFAGYLKEGFAKKRWATFT